MDETGAELLGISHLDGQSLALVVAIGALGLGVALVALRFGALGMSAVALHPARVVPREGLGHQTP